MQTKQIAFYYEEYNSIEELQEKEKQLFSKAVEASKSAYAPYSHFDVGAALELENGKIIVGNNQENAAYPSGLCAERVGLFSASANFPHQAIKAIAIAATNQQGEIIPATPCGACCQAMSEYEYLSKNPIQIIFLNLDSKIVVLKGVDSLLPFRFK